MPAIPRLPLVPDPLRRVRVPRDLGAVTVIGDEDAGAGGLDAAVAERIWASAVDLYRSGVHPALQLCVRRNGAVAVQRAIGHARGNGPGDPEDTEKVRVDLETPFCVYSTSKAVTAFVVHMLEERGALSISDRIADHIPEYAAHGKGEITIGQVLAHRAGVARISGDALDLDRLADREALVRLLCEVKPAHAPGRLLAYHAVSGGFILGEIVHRVTGKDIRTVLAEEILDPLGFRWGNYGVGTEDLDRVGPSYLTGPPLLPPLSTLLNRALGAPLSTVVEIGNDPRFLSAIVPAANVVTNADELSRFFEIFRCGGELDGVRVIAPSTLRRALTEQSRLEIDLSLGFPSRFGYGLMLGAKVLSLYGRDTDLAFGHLGLTNIMGWADPERGVAVGLVTSGKPTVYPEVHRFFGVMGKIASEVPKLPESERPFQ
jgi:CubicO group peptidase (beta-lactamase class C family)